MNWHVWELIVETGYYSGIVSCSRFAEYTLFHFFRHIGRYFGLLMTETMDKPIDNPIEGTAIWPKKQTKLNTI